MELDQILHKKKKGWQRPRVIAFSVAIIATVALGYGVLAERDTQVSKDELQIEIVKRGDLDLVVKGFGKLKAHKKRILTAARNATVEEVLLYPGAAVQPDTVIATLYDPELERNLKEAEAHWKQKKAEFKEYELVQQSEHWGISADVKRLKLEVKNLSFIYESKKMMEEKGVVSKFDLAVTQTSLESKKLELELAQSKKVQFELISKLRLAIKEDIVAQALSTVQIYRDSTEQNRVRAGMVGILQELQVEVGQSVEAGSKLALVGSTEDLIAELSVPQRDANKINVGNLVSINTFGDNGAGVVSRIDPVVTKGKILVEVKIEGVMPSNARPELSVEGSIMIHRLVDVLFVRQSAQIAPNSDQQLFLLEKDGQSAVKVPLSFGDASTQFVQVKQGAKEGDRLVVSVPSNLKMSERISLKP